MSYFPDDAMATHNNLIDILAQTGVVGFTLCLWFFFGLAWSGYQLCQKLKERNDFLAGLANAAFAGTLSCTITMFFGDWLFPFAYTQTITGFDYVVYSWLFMGTIPVIYRLSQAESTPMNPT
jgi:O-antigen ligase